VVGGGGGGGEACVLLSRSLVSGGDKRMLVGQSRQERWRGITEEAVGEY
jgi:hypothetical protein